MRRAEIIAEARSWLGTRYVHQGRLKGVGGDCLAAIQGILAKWGLPHEDKSAYSRYGLGAFALEAELRKWLVPVSPLHCRPGDIAAFAVHESRPAFTCHAGVLTELGLLHCNAMIGSYVEHRLDDYWRKKMTYAFSIPGVED